MEIGGDLEVVWVAIAASPLLDGGDLGVQAFGNGVGDAMREVGQHVGKMTGDQMNDQAFQSLSDRLRHGNVMAAQCPSRVLLQHLTSRCGVLVLGKH